MSCDELDDLIESLVAGDAAMTGEIRAHLDRCPRCRDAYALASSIEHTLAAQPVPIVPEEFAPAVMARVRRHRWRSEQRLDLAFNLLVGLTVLVAVGGLFAVLTVSGLAAVSADLVRVFVRGTAEVTARAVPQMGLYVATLLLVVSGLGVWWWAERGFEM